jgi:predicted nucleic acid-binding protein
MIILDTNVLSEAMKPSPSARVLSWLAEHPPSRLFTTTITQAEILYGLELLPAGKRRAALESAVEAMFEEDFAGRILPFDCNAARMFPQVAAARRAAGRPATQFDAQIAAIARSRGAILATRNTSDFEHCGVAVLNPWIAR